MKILTACLVAAGVAWAVFAADQKPAKKDEKKVPPASAETVKLVKFFMKVPTADLPPERVPEFMEVNPDSLPAKLQTPYLAKKEELLTLKKIADSRKKPPVRRGGMEDWPADSCRPDPPKYMIVLPQVGYLVITEEEEAYLKEKTKCTECDLITEFTLRIVENPKKTGGKKELVYFLHVKDPLFNLVGAYRAGRRNPFGTNFFGLGYPTCH